MCRISTMAKFADPDNTEPRLVGECTNCGQDFYEGDEVLKNDDGIFCDLICVKEHYGLVWHDLERDD